MILLKSIYTYLVWNSIIIEVVLGLATIGWIRFVPTIGCFESYVTIHVTRAIPSGECTAVIIVSVEITILITWKNYWRMGSSGFPKSISLANWMIWEQQTWPFLLTLTAFLRATLASFLLPPAITRPGLSSSFTFFVSWTSCIDLVTPKKISFFRNWDKKIYVCRHISHKSHVKAYTLILWQYIGTISFFSITPLYQLSGNLMQKKTTLTQCNV